MELRPSSFRSVYTPSPYDGWMDVWILCQPVRHSSIRSRLGDPYLRLDPPRLAYFGRTAFVGFGLSMVQPKQIWDLDGCKPTDVVPEGSVPVRRLPRHVQSTLPTF